MRLKFILVGFVLALFVFPYVLNIGEAEAQSGVKCVRMKPGPKKIQCFRQKVRKKNKIIKELRADIKQLEEDLQTVEPDSDREARNWERKYKNCSTNFEGAIQLGTTVGKDGNIIMVKQTAKKVNTEIKKLTDGLDRIIYDSENILKQINIKHLYPNSKSGKAKLSSNMKDAREDLTRIQTSLAELAQATK